MSCFHLNRAILSPKPASQRGLSATAVSQLSTELLNCFKWFFSVFLKFHPQNIQTVSRGTGSSYSAEGHRPGASLEARPRLQLPSVHRGADTPRGAVTSDARAPTTGWVLPADWSATSAPSFREAFLPHPLNSPWSPLISVSTPIL